jgi:hypothetical protein
MDSLFRLLQQSFRQGFSSDDLDRKVKNVCISNVFESKIKEDTKEREEKKYFLQALLKLWFVSH